MLDSQTFLLESSRYTILALKTVVVITPVTEMMVPSVHHTARDGRMALQSDDMNLALDKMQLFVADFMVEWKKAGCGG